MGSMEEMLGTVMPGDSQQLVVMPGDSQQLVVMPGDSQQLVVMPGDSQQLVVMPGDSQQLVNSVCEALTRSRSHPGGFSACGLVF